MIQRTYEIPPAWIGLLQALAFLLGVGVPEGMAASSAVTNEGVALRLEVRDCDAESTPIVADISLLNLGPKPRSVFWWPGFLLETEIGGVVITETTTGQLVPAKVSLQEAANGLDLHGSSTFRDLAPGQPLRGSMDLSARFRLVPGTYSVAAYCHLVVSTNPAARETAARVRLETPPVTVIVSGKYALPHVSTTGPEQPEMLRMIRKDLAQRGLPFPLSVLETNPPPGEANPEAWRCRAGLTPPEQPGSHPPRRERRHGSSTVTDPPVEASTETVPHPLAGAAPPWTRWRIAVTLGLGAVLATVLVLRRGRPCR